MSIVIKCSLRSDLRRFTLPSGDGLFTRIKQRAAESFGLPGDATWCLWWQDAEADRIRVASELDIKEMLSSGIHTTPRGTVLRLEISTEVGAEQAIAELQVPAETKEKKASGPGQFFTLLHLATSTEIAVHGQTLPNGRIVFRLDGCCKNVAIGPKGVLSHSGGQGPWAQFSVSPAEDGGVYLQNHGNKEKGWSVGFDADNDTLVMCPTPDAVAWRLIACDGSPFTAPPPEKWYVDKVAAKAAAKEAETTVTKVATPAAAPMQKMLYTLTVAGNVDGRAAAKGSLLSVHASDKKDIFDNNGTWAMATSQGKKASIWSIEQGGWVPDGLVTIAVAGNCDGRTTAMDWSLMVANDAKPPHRRDACSAYVLTTRTMGKKGGLWAIEPCAEDRGLCRLRYAGNRDGRAGAEGFYLAVHNSRGDDKRDAVSSYAIVTRDAAKASLWDMRPFWGAIPPPQRKKVELDSAGNPKVGFHTAKKKAQQGIQSALRALFAPFEAPAPSAVSAAAAVHSLRVAAEWIKKKTGLPIHVGQLSNDEALSVARKLRELPMSLPKWAAAGLDVPADAPARVDAVLAALGAPMQALWADELSGDVELVQQQAPEVAVMQRQDGVQHTMLRRAPTPDYHNWVDSRACVSQGEQVKVLRREGDFTFVRSKCGAEGFVKTKHLAAKVSDAAADISGAAAGIPLDTPLYLLGPHGTNVQCNKENQARCANGNMKAWEQLVILRSGVDPDKYLIRSDKNGHHLQCRKDGTLVFANKNDKLWEHWAIEHEDGVCYFVSAHTGKVMQARRDGSMRCANYNRKGYEAFRFKTKAQANAEAKAVKASAKAEPKAKAPVAPTVVPDVAIMSETVKCMMGLEPAVLELDASAPASACKHFSGNDPAWGGHSVVHGKAGWVEYAIETDSARSVMIAVQYNGKDSRPLRLSLNSTVVEENFAPGATGTWKDQRMLRWDEAGPFDLPAGTTLMRLETDGYFPHLKQFRVTQAARDTSCGGAPFPVVPSLDLPPAYGTGSELEQLNLMGFATPRANQHALAAANGDLAVAVDILLTSDFAALE